MLNDDQVLTLLDNDPEKLIKYARELASYTGPGKNAVESNRAGHLIDAGVRCKDVEAIQEGVVILESLIEKGPQPTHFYNLANGFASLEQLHKYTNEVWYLETWEWRWKARKYLRHVASGDGYEVKARAYSNLADQHLRAFRWVEAYDCYLNALRWDPRHGIAATGAFSILNQLLKRGIGSKNELLRAARKHLEVAKKDPEYIRQLGGKKALEALRPLLSLEIPEPPASGPPRELDAFETFVAENRLALSPTIEGVPPDLRTWDRLRLPGIVTPVDAGTPPIFAMFNTIVSDYLACRWLAYQALEEAIPDSGKYVDTLDYATYGVNTSALTIAQSTAIDILDKIAVALTEYFGLPEKEDPRSITFMKRWYLWDNNKPSDWNENIKNEIMAGNRPLIALAEMSADLRKGALGFHKKLRDASTHRFTVFHDMGGREEVDTKQVEHYDLDTFSEELTHTLKLVRAAILYFVDVIATNEGKKAKSDSGLTMPVYLPDHDWVRGRDEEET